jgi:uncharacterized SAM-binding protein YcdF (DUF218 family)
MHTPQQFLGLLTRKERWGLSWRGWLAAVLLVLLAGWALLLETYPFLAVTHRVDTHCLAVEGWVHDFVIQAAVVEFKAGSYERVYATGGPVSGLGHYVNDFQTSASVGAGRLKAAGIPGESVQMVPSHVMNRDRTFASAVALRDWLRDHHMSVHAINVMTEDVHARRTRLLFQEALGKDAAVGIIAVPNPDYDSAHWWRYSEGVRDVLGEVIAYVYAKLFFYPPAAKTP